MVEALLLFVPLGLATWAAFWWLDKHSTWTLVERVQAETHTRQTWRNGFGKERTLRCEKNSTLWCNAATGGIDLDLGSCAEAVERKVAWKRKEVEHAQQD